METGSDFSVSHGSSHFHVLENATSLITISSPPWWKELLFLLFELFPPLTCPSPELGTQRPSSQSPVGVRAVTGHPEHREQHIPYGRTPTITALPAVAPGY